MHAARLHDEVIDAALSCAATLLGMEVVFIGGIDDATFRFERVSGDWPGIVEGGEIEFSATFCRRMLDGAPPSTADAAIDPAYVDTPGRTKFRVTSYVGVPIHDFTGHVIGTLCGIDHDEYHTWLDAHVRARGVPPASVARTYGRFVRALVAEAWAHRPSSPPYTLAP